MLKKWINNWLNGEEPQELIISEDEKMLTGLNLKEVLDAHDMWKIKLQDELTGSSSTPIDITVVASDCKCILGKWLHGTGKKVYSKYPEYKRALDAHANFHICAAEVVIEHQSGNTKKAKNILTTKFRTASNNNQLELVRLFTVAQK